MFLVWFIKLLIQFTNAIFPKEKADKNYIRACNIFHTGMLSTSELGILQARKETILFARQVKDMYAMMKKMFAETKPKDIETQHGHIRLFEKEMDQKEVDIAAYITRISENDLSISGTREIRTLLKINDNIESIADAVYNISRILQKKSNKRIWFPPELRQKVQLMFHMIDEAFLLMLRNLSGDNEKSLNIDSPEDLEDKINLLRNKFKKENMDNIKKEEYRYQAGVTFLDIISLCETIGDHHINISEALFEERMDKS